MKKWKFTAKRWFEPLRQPAARVRPLRRGFWGVLLVLLAWARAARADVPPLQPKGYTNDYAGVLSAGAVAQADALAAEVERKTGAQMAVVIVKSLDGQPIEDYANTLARRWGIGRKDNRGILLLLAIQERRDRLEVGYGLEPILPDGKVGGILRGLRPYLQQGNYDAAVLTALGAISAVIAQEAGVTLETRAPPGPPAAQYHSRGVDLPWWVILLGVGGLVLFILITGMNPLFFLMGGVPGWGGPGGRERDGNWDGGGFSGFGGGDFGGGGASSDW